MNDPDDHDQPKKEPLQRTLTRWEREAMDDLQKYADDLREILRKLRRRLFH